MSEINNIDYRPDVSDEIREDLPNFYSGDRMDAFIQAISSGFQTLHDDIFAVWTGTSLQSARGKALESWGDWVGEPKRELTETQYRRIIRAKIAARNTDGNAPDLKSVYQTALDASDVLRIGAYPAGVALTAIVEEMPGDHYSDRVRKIANIAKPTGVSIKLKVAFSDYFAFGDDLEGNTTARIL
jgi:hypothetical protein